MTGTGGGQNKEVMTRTRSYKVEKKIEKCRMDFWRTCAGYASFRKAFYVAASLAIVALMVLTVGFSVQAVGERVYFGSEGYRWNLGTISPIGVYAGADTSFESVEWNVYYDASVLEYVSGGELVEPGVVRVSASGINGNSYMQMLQFVPRVSGSTQIRIGNASVVAADGGGVSNLQAVVNVEIPLAGGCALEEMRVNGTPVDGFSTEVTFYAMEVAAQDKQIELEVNPDGEETQITVEVGTLQNVWNWQTVEASGGTYRIPLEDGENVVHVMTQNVSGERARYALSVTKPENPQDAAGGNGSNEDDGNSGNGSGNSEGNVGDGNSQKGNVDGDSNLANSGLCDMGYEKILLIVMMVTVVLLAISTVFLLWREKKRRERRRGLRRERRRAKGSRPSQGEILGQGNRRGGEPRQGRHKSRVGQKGFQTFDLKENQQGMDAGQTLAEEAEIEIMVENVTMEFKHESDEATSIKEMLIRTVKGQRKVERFKALDDVSFTVRKGEVIGIIGTNGSGKSTILKIISGALIPTAGKIIVNRNKIQLLTLGTGFDFELTGRENVYLNGSIIGYTKEYIDEKYDDIVKFAELEGFMEEKVRNYSSGMVSRLGFAIATVRDTPEILILDEVLSVGDMFFRQKSEKRIQEMIHGGSTVLIVSHSTSVIRNNCTKVVWIEKGILRAIGEPGEVCDAYEKMNEAV